MCMYVLSILDSIITPKSTLYKRQPAWSRPLSTESSACHLAWLLQLSICSDVCTNVKVGEGEKQHSNRWTYSATVFGHNWIIYFFIQSPLKKSTYSFMNEWMRPQQMIVQSAASDNLPSLYIYFFGDGMVGEWRIFFLFCTTKTNDHFFRLMWCFKLCETFSFIKKKRRMQMVRPPPFLWMTLNCRLNYFFLFTCYLVLFDHSLLVEQLTTTKKLSKSFVYLIKFLVKLFLYK